MFDRILNAPLEGVRYLIFLQVKDSYFSYLVDIVFDDHIILDYDNSNSTFFFYGFSPNNSWVMAEAGLHLRSKKNGCSEEFSPNIHENI